MRVIILEVDWLPAPVSSVRSVWYELRERWEVNCNLPWIGSFTVEQAKGKLR